MDASNFLLIVVAILATVLLISLIIDGVLYTRSRKVVSDAGTQKVHPMFDITFPVGCVCGIVGALCVFVAMYFADQNAAKTRERKINESIVECVQVGGMPSIVMNEDNDVEFGSCEPMP